MNIRTEPLLVLGYGVWEMDDGPAKRADGSEVERVDLYDAAQGEVYQWSLVEGLGSSDCPPAGTAVEVEARCEVRQKSGRDGVVRKGHKFTVVGIRVPNGKPAPAPKAEKSAA